MVLFSANKQINQHSVFSTNYSFVKITQSCVSLHNGTANKHVNTNKAKHSFLAMQIKCNLIWWQIYRWAMWFNSAPDVCTLAVEQEDKEENLVTNNYCTVH